MQLVLYHIAHAVSISKWANAMLVQ